MLAFLLSHALAAPAPNAAFVAQVQAKYASVPALHAEFTQAVKSEVFGEHTSSGELTVERPNKVRWHTMGKTESLVVSDGNTVWTWDPGQNTVIVVRDPSVAQTLADYTFNHLAQLDKLYTVTAEPQDGGQHLILVPKDDGLYDRLDVYVGADLVVKKIVMADDLGNKTELSLTAVDFPKDVDDAQFTFVPPKGAQIVESGS